MTTRHEQALARIEEWRNENITLQDESMVPKDLQKEIALSNLKAVLELHTTLHPSSYVETGGICNECLSDNPCPTADLIIKGVL